MSDEFNNGDNRRGDRRHVPLSQVATLVMLALQLAALVWGAATLKSSVDQLKVTVEDIGAEMKVNRARITGLELEQAIIRDRQLRRP